MVSVFVFGEDVNPLTSREKRDWFINTLIGRALFFQKLRPRAIFSGHAGVVELLLSTRIDDQASDPLTGIYRKFAHARCCGLNFGDARSALSGSPEGCCLVNPKFALFFRARGEMKILNSIAEFFWNREQISTKECSSGLQVTTTGGGWLTG